MRAVRRRSPAAAPARCCRWSAATTELARISRRRSRRARSGDGRLVELRGEPGIGKSRLLEELHEAAAGASGCCRRRARRTSAATPYAPWRELLPRPARRPLRPAPPGVVLERLRRRSGGARSGARAVAPAARGSARRSRCRPPGQLVPALRVRSAALACRRPCSDLLRACPPGAGGARVRAGASHGRRVGCRCSRRCVDAARRPALAGGHDAARPAPAASKHRAAQHVQTLAAPSRSRRRTPRNLAEPVDRGAGRSRRTSSRSRPERSGRQPAVPARPAGRCGLQQRDAARDDRGRGDRTHRPPRGPRIASSSGAPRSWAPVSIRGMLADVVDGAAGPVPRTCCTGSATCSPTTATAG